MAGLRWAALSRAGGLAALGAAALAPGLVLAAHPGAWAARAAGGTLARTLSSQCIATSRSPTATTPWTLQELAPAGFWGMTTGSGQIVAVLDSGVSAAAPSLAGAVLPGRNVLSGGPADTDCLGHGTFVAGIIAGHPVPGTAFTGLAPGVRILPVNVVSINQDSNPSVTPRALAAGIRYAVAAGASIIDVSASVTPGPAPVLRAAVRLAEASNVVVVAPAAATGNTASQDTQAGYPAAFPGVISVTAAGPGGALVETTGSQAQPDLAAPGTDVPGIGPHGLGQLTGAGDSIATAFVAATAALVRSYYPQLSAAQVTARLELTAQSPGTAVPSPVAGYGEVDPYDAVTMMLPQESGGRAPRMVRPPAVHLPSVPVPDRWPVNAALLACVVVPVGVALAFSAARVVPHGRRRQWRPAPSLSQRRAAVPAVLSPDVDRRPAPRRPAQSAQADRRPAPRQPVRAPGPGHRPR
jgi:membrane-anchored mycosin MYCP